MIENLYWGKELQFGYAKHPPLFAWVSYFFYKLCFSWPESLYFLTQLNLVLGFYFIFKISELIFKDKTKSYAAILIFMASIGSVFGNEKFNATTILMSLFPAMFYFFIRMLKFNKYSDAIAFGIFCALAVVGKYFALLYIACVGLFLILNKECRKFFKTPQIYVAAGVFLICVSWHVVWMFENDLITLKYAFDKTAAQSRLSAFNFLAMQTLFSATSFFAVAYACKGKIKLWPDEWSKISLEEKFIIFITIAPNVLLFLVSLATGMRIGSFWGANMFTTGGVYLLIVNKNLDFDRLFVFVKRITTFFAAVLFIKLGVARVLLKEYDPTNAIDIRKISRKMDEDWRANFGDQKMKIIATDKALAALHIHLKDSPSYYDVKNLRIYSDGDSFPTDETVVVAFLSRRRCEKDAARSSSVIFDDDARRRVLFENKIRVIGDYFVYYAFVNTAHNNERN
jgi:4-amino-4-deoxy-L-arabinose transferase-like glycosyltransferase